MWKNKWFSKRVAKRIRNLQAEFINTRMTSFCMYVSVSWGAVIKKMWKLFACFCCGMKYFEIKVYIIVEPGKPTSNNGLLYQESPWFTWDVIVNLLSWALETSLLRHEIFWNKFVGLWNFFTPAVSDFSLKLRWKCTDKMHLRGPSFKMSTHYTFWITLVRFQG